MNVELLTVTVVHNSWACGACVRPNFAHRHDPAGAAPRFAHADKSPNSSMRLVPGRRRADPHFAYWGAGTSPRILPAHGIHAQTEPGIGWRCRWRVVSSSGWLAEALYRGFEVLIALVGLTLGLPVMLAEASLIRWDSPGPILFFHQVRDAR
jgi:hypothetical protein